MNTYKGKMYENTPADKRKAEICSHQKLLQQFKFLDSKHIKSTVNDTIRYGASIYFSYLRKFQKKKIIIILLLSKNS